MNAVVRPIPGLEPATRAAMLTLLDRHFAGVTPEQFDRDLDEKDHALLLRERSGALVGFSTMVIYPERDADGRPATVVCSGDTIVAPHAWGRSSLAQTWINAVLDLHASRGGRGPLYWLLITSGVRTYRFLPVFFEEFFPRFDLPTPPDVQRWMDRLAAARWGDAYDAVRGVVRFTQPYPLRGELAEAHLRRTDDPHVAFFLRRNPGHAKGDELVSVAELSPRNLSRAGRRMLEAGRRRRLRETA